MSLRKGSMSFSLPISEGLFCEEVQDLLPVVAEPKTRATGLKFQKDIFLSYCKEGFLNLSNLYGVLQGSESSVSGDIQTVCTNIAQRLECLFEPEDQ